MDRLLFVIKVVCVVEIDFCVVFEFILSVEYRFKFEFGFILLLTFKFGFGIIDDFVIIILSGCLRLRGCLFDILVLMFAIMFFILLIVWLLVLGLMYVVDVKLFEFVELIEFK